MKQYRATVACLLAISALGNSASLAADAAHGREIAQRWCASCHLVTPEQRQGSADAAPFSTIARMPNMDAPHIAFLLLDPHPKMPDMSLTRNEASDLAAYIASLK
jgi:mono/diheme cytochrome c family protein